MGFTYTYSKPPARDVPRNPPDTDLLLENTHVLPRAVNMSMFHENTSVAPPSRYRRVFQLGP